MIWLYSLIFIVSSLVLVRSGLWVVKAIIKISQFLKWKEFIVATFLMAFSTSLPELFIGITSAIHGKPELSFGMIIGSNIIVLTLVMGLGAIFAKGIKIEGKALQRSSIYAAFYGIFPLLLMVDGYLSRIDGIILLLALNLYFGQLLAQKTRFKKIFSNTFKAEWSHFKLFLKNLLTLFLGIFLLLLSSEVIVFSILKLVALSNLPLVIVGVLVVALGTSLPEIAFGIRSITMGHENMVLGDIMGSVVINSTLVLGLVAVISPFTISDFSPYLKGIIFTLATCLFFIIFARTDRKITKKEALFLLAIYITFILSESLIR